MGPDWNKFADLARKSLKEDGAAAVVKINESPSSGEKYDIITGKTNFNSPSYNTNGIITNYELDAHPDISPEDVKILIHTGEKSNPLPDLMNKKNISIEIINKTYKVKRVKAINPAGTVILYELQASELYGQ